MSRWSHKDALAEALNTPVIPKAESNVGLGGMAGNGSGYDAASESTARSVIAFPTNSYLELSTATRTKLVQKVRALDANLSLITRIIGKISQHAVGKGIFVRPTTKDVEWNEEARRLYEEWASNPGVYSIDASRDHYEDQQLVAETMVADGEYFAALVKSENGAPMIQPLDVFEIAQPWGSPSSNVARYTDGVRSNDYNRAVGYAVQELSKPGIYQAPNFREVAAQNMLHVFRRKRAKGFRGVTWFHSGINKGIDALDLQALITGTAKLHSGLAVTVKGAGQPKSRGAISAIKSEGAKDTDDFKGLERVYGGGIISYLSDNGEVKLHSSDHPGENLIEFLKYLYCDIANSVRLPLEVVYSMAPLGGVGARATMEDAQWLFDSIQDKVIWRHSFPIYRWRIANFIKEGRLRPCKDPIWWSTSWRGPAKLTVDIGRTADANIKLIKNGALTHSRYYEERGLDARQEITDQVEFRAWLQDLCEKRGVDINAIIEPTPGTVNQINVAEPDKP